MIPKRIFEEMKGVEVKIYMTGLPDPHCVQKGVIVSITEHVLTIRDEAHTDTLIIPLENIVFFKKL
jgi:hypothetical protein